MISSVISIVIQALQRRGTWIGITVVLSFVLLFIFFQKPVDTSKYYEKIDELEEKVQDLQTRDTSLSIQITSLRVQEAELLEQNLGLIQELTNLQSTYEEDITFIDSASTDELTEFFTDRYRYLLRTSP